MQKFFNITNETEHVVKIELVNGKKHNPLSLELIKQLKNSLIQISSQKKVKVLIISSEGPGFSAGHDLDELRKNKNLAAIESDYSKNKPEIKIVINRKKAQDLGVSIQ